ncbi:flippase [Nanoarchaeota archaeon]
MNAKKFSKAIFLVYIFAFIGSVSSYLIRILFSRQLTIAEYGLVYAVISFIFLLAPLRDLGMYESEIFFMSKYVAKKDYKKAKGVLWISLLPQLIFGFVIAGIVYIVKGYLVLNFFRNPKADFLIDILLIMFLFGTLVPTLSAVFGAFQRLVIFNMKNYVNMTLIFLFSLLFFYLGFGINSTVYAYLAAAFFLVIIHYILYKLLIKEMCVKAYYDVKMTKKIFGYALPILFSSFATILLFYTDNLVLTWMKGTESVGYYNVVVPSLNVILVMITPLASVLFPVLSNFYHKKDSKMLSKVVSSLYNNLLIVTLPIAILFFLYSKEIIAFLFGAKYIPATFVLKVYILFFVFIALRSINFAVIAAIGKARERSRIMYYGAFINLILDFILIYYFDYLGAAIATGIGFIVMAYLTMRIIMKSINIKLDISAILGTLASCILFGISSTILQKFIFFGNSLFAIMGEGFIVLSMSSIIYIISLFLFKVITKDKIFFVMNIIRRKSDL